MWGILARLRAPQPRRCHSLEAVAEKAVSVGFALAGLGCRTYRLAIADCNVVVAGYTTVPGVIAQTMAAAADHMPCRADHTAAVANDEGREPRFLWAIQRDAL